MASKYALRFQFGKDKRGQWWWHIRARNGEIVAQNESLKRRASVMKVWKLIVQHGEEMAMDEVI